MQGQELEKIVLHGSPEEMGMQHGEVLRDTIRSLAEDRVGVIRRATGVLRTEIEGHARDIERIAEDALPLVWREALATATTAGVEPWELVVAGGFSDVLDRCAKSSGIVASANECTLTGARLEDGSSLIVGTWDTHGSAQDSLVMIERHPNYGPSTLALSTAGWPMQQGLNSSGLGFAIANLVAEQGKRGVSYICSLPKIATADNVDEAIRIASSIPLCSARYFVFSDPRSATAGLETDGSVFFPVDGCKPHTNHFVSAEACSLEGRPQLIAESEGRRQAMARAFGVPLAAVEEFYTILTRRLSPHTTVIKEGTGDADRTGASFAIEVDAGRIWYTNGPPTSGSLFCSTISNHQEGNQ